MFLCWIVIHSAWTETSRRFNAGKKKKNRVKWRCVSRDLQGKKELQLYEKRMRCLSGTSLWFSRKTSTSRAAVRRSVPAGLLRRGSRVSSFPSALLLMLGQHHGRLSHWLTQRKTCHKYLIRKRNKFGPGVHENTLHFSNKWNTTGKDCVFISPPNKSRCFE